jgi:hypothetical protein
MFYVCQGSCLCGTVNNRGKVSQVDLVSNFYLNDSFFKGHLLLWRFGSTPRWDVCRRWRSHEHNYQQGPSNCSTWALGLRDFSSVSALYSFEVRLRTLRWTKTFFQAWWFWFSFARVWTRWDAIWWRWLKGFHFITTTTWSATTQRPRHHCTARTPPWTQWLVNCKTQRWRFEQKEHIRYKFMHL